MSIELDANTELSLVLHIVVYIDKMITITKAVTSSATYCPVPVYTPLQDLQADDVSIPHLTSSRLRCVAAAKYKELKVTALELLPLA
jgi:hypothetical protein